MAKIDIPFLVAKTNKSGRTNWYWQPSAALAKAGWKSLPLGTDETAAIDAARKRNQELETWKQGGARPREVRRFVKASTVGALIARYKADGWPRLSDPTRSIAGTTRETYSAAFDKIERWAGDFPISSITPARIRVFRDALLKGQGHTVAYNTLSVLRTLFKYGESIDAVAKGSNPATEFGLAAPPPRDQIWDEDGTGADVEAFGRGADAIGAPELAFAIELFEHLGQREADMLKLNESQWAEIKNLAAADHDILAAADGPDAGKVMGFFVRQGKTKRWVGVPIAGEIRRKVEARIATNRARNEERRQAAIVKSKRTGDPVALPMPVTTILVDERTGRPWRDRFAFIARFNEAKAWAVAELRRQGEIEAADRLAELQIRDLRRTAVVRMGELNLEDQLIAAITGHRLETVKRILETYMPRTTKMAARAAVARLADRRQQATDMEARK